MAITWVLVFRLFESCCGVKNHERRSISHGRIWEKAEEKALATE